MRPTPPLAQLTDEHPYNNLDRAAVRFTQSSNAPNDFQARRHFEAGWRIIQSELAIIIRGVVHSDARVEGSYHELVDDTLSFTALKLWVYLRGNETTPTPRRTIGGGLIKTTALNAYRTLVDRQVRNERQTAPLDDTIPTAATDVDHDTMFEQLAKVAEKTFRKPLWAAIFRQIANGHAFRIDIAEVLGVNANTIRSAFLHIRRSNIFEHLDLPITAAPQASDVAVDRARLLIEAAYQSFEQLRLFDPTTLDPAQVPA